MCIYAVVTYSTPNGSYLTSSLFLPILVVSLPSDQVPAPPSKTTNYRI